jgi:hypothetical protein
MSNNNFSFEKYYESNVSSSYKISSEIEIEGHGMNYRNCLKYFKQFPRESQPYVYEHDMEAAKQYGKHISLLATLHVIFSGKMFEYYTSGMIKTHEICNDVGETLWDIEEELDVFRKLQCKQIIPDIFNIVKEYVVPDRVEKGYNIFDLDFQIIKIIAPNNKKHSDSLRKLSSGIIKGESDFDNHNLGFKTNMNIKTSVMYITYGGYNNYKSIFKDILNIHDRFRGNKSKLYKYLLG